MNTPLALILACISRENVYKTCIHTLKVAAFGPIVKVPDSEEKVDLIDLLT